MDSKAFSGSRRQFLTQAAAGAGAVGAAFYFVPGLFAEELSLTPRLTEGPFYPDKLPLDRDNDLVIVGDSTTPAVGEITHLTGRVLSPSGEPINNATIEIWQVDHNGVYLNTRDSGHRQRDANFQGYGTFTTASNGEYRFRTIKPVPYTGRTPHIHLRVNKGDRELLTTQVFIDGFPQNRSDGVLNGIRDPIDRELVLVDFKPVKDSRIGELSARFDIVIGRTPSDRPDGERPSRSRG
ncbi:MAG TPA: protocatechuate 3,4-dioxygenase [Pirellulales bacterium]|jgi:protocatechuate 3,4-dioxygenase beta subunit|nr:protocatechuate 3,4-dioxygenase [Pirellulales bacterium]